VVTEKLRQWLIFFRAHTGTLEAPIAAFGAAAALGTVFDPRVALWALVGLLYHYGGYGQNSYYDWDNGYDKDDPHKQHHPLNAGSISPRVAKHAANIAVLGYLVITIWLVMSTPVAVAITIGAFVCGLMYNVIGKRVKHKWLLLAISHSSLFIIPYAHYSGIDLFSVLITIALISHHAFQIAISGDIKDIGQDESSMLNEIGIYSSKAKVWNQFGEESKSSSQRIRCSLKAILAVVTITSFQIATVLVVNVLHYNTLNTDVLLLTLTIFMSGLCLIYLSVSIVKTGEYNRETRLQQISVREVVGFWTIYIAIIPIVGINGYLIALILTISYVIIHSKFMWGTILRPEV